MSNKLNEVLKVYIDKVKSRFSSNTNTCKVKALKKQFDNKVIVLNSLIYQLESSPEFEQLTSETYSSFLGDYHGGRKQWGWSLGNDDNERKREKKQFKDPYNLRCDLVHGNSIPRQKVYIGDLRKYRDLARRIILWFLNYLTFIKEESLKLQSPMLTREELLALLDLEQKSRKNLSSIITLLQTEFPYIKEWLK